MIISTEKYILKNFDLDEFIKKYKNLKNLENNYINSELLKNHKRTYRFIINNENLIYNNNTSYISKLNTKLNGFINNTDIKKKIKFLSKQQTFNIINEKLFDYFKISLNDYTRSIDPLARYIEIRQNKGIFTIISLYKNNNNILMNIVNKKNNERTYFASLIIKTHEKEYMLCEIYITFEINFTSNKITIKLVYEYDNIFNKIFLEKLMELNYNIELINLYDKLDNNSNNIFKIIEKIKNKEKFKEYIQTVLYEISENSGISINNISPKTQKLRKNFIESLNLSKSLKFGINNSDIFIISFNEDKKTYEKLDCIVLIARIIIDNPSLIVVCTQKSKFKGNNHFQHILKEQLLQLQYELYEHKSSKCSISIRSLECIKTRIYVKENIILDNFSYDEPKYNETITTRTKFTYNNNNFIFFNLFLNNKINQETLKDMNIILKNLSKTNNVFLCENDIINYSNINGTKYSFDVSNNKNKILLLSLRNSSNNFNF